MARFDYLNLNIKISRSGQGLLEATLAIGLILVGLGALLTFTLKNVSAVTDSGQRITAANLAREGIDAVRGIRDSNWLKATNSDPSRVWDADLVPAANDQGVIVVWHLPTTLPVAPAEFTLEYITSRDVNDSKFALYRHRQNHYWLQSQTPPVAGSYLATGYNRLVLIDPICQPVSGSATINVGQTSCTSGTKIGLRVQVEVSWQASGIFGAERRRSLTMTEYLYNWR